MGKSNLSKWGMAITNHQTNQDLFVRPDEGALIQANVNPKTGLATDFLNLFNEYIMLAELVADGSMDHEELGDWLPIDYETHFSRSGFAGAEIVLASFRSLPHCARDDFEIHVAELISLILYHQDLNPSPLQLLDQIRRQRDFVAALISEPAPANVEEVEDAQAAIDALFN